MREIKFRGISLPDRVWVHGDFRMDTTGLVAISEIHGPVLKVFIVRPETVGQFTGLHDADGTEVYEGDIVEEKSLGFVGRVVYMSDLGAYYVKFRTKDGTSQKTMAVVFTTKGRVIGNIHENPELLESRKDD